MSICTNCHGASSAGCYVCNPEAHPDIQYGYNLVTIGKPVTTQLDRIEAQNAEILALLTKKKVSKPRASKDEYPEWFENIWTEYPKRSGSNPKRKAFEACTARINEAFEINGYVDCADYLWSRTVDYCKYCDAVYTDKRYVMQAATFFGYSKPYEGDFTIPDTVKKSAIPRDNDEMLTWAVKKGMRQPHQGESWNQYRAYIEGEA